MQKQRSCTVWNTKQPSFVLILAFHSEIWQIVFNFTEARLLETAPAKSHKDVDNMNGCLLDAAGQEGREPHPGASGLKEDTSKSKCAEAQLQFMCFKSFQSDSGCRLELISKSISVSQVFQN